MQKHFAKKIIVLGLAVLFFVSGCGKTTGSTSGGDKANTQTDKFFSVYYGTVGGNMRPLSISIDDKGIVTGDDVNSQSCIKKNLKLSNEQLQSIVETANKNNFFNLPDEIGSGMPKPDLSGRFILLTTSATTKKVLLRPGSSDAGFQNLFSYINGLATQNGCGL